MQDKAKPLTRKQEVVTGALPRLADAHGFSGPEMAKILGVSEATYHRFKSGKSTLSGIHYEAAVLFVRVCRSLHGIYGTVSTNTKNWLSSYNEHLCGIPKEMLATIEGKVHVSEYLDAMRGKV